MNGSEFQIPEFNRNREEDYRILAKLEDIARTVSQENSFFKRIEFDDVYGEARLFFCEGKVQRAFKESVAQEKSGAGGKDLEWHFYAFFSRSFRNRLEDLSAQKYSMVKTSRIRSYDTDRVKNSKLYASGVGPSVSLDEEVSSSSDGGSAYHEIVGGGIGDDIANSTHRTRQITNLKEKHPVLYARLFDALKKPSDAVSVSGKKLSYRERTQTAIHDLYTLIGKADLPEGDEYDDLEAMLVNLMSGWRAVRGSYAPRN